MTKGQNVSSRFNAMSSVALVTASMDSNQVFLFPRVFSSRNGASTVVLKDVFCSPHVKHTAFPYDFSKHTLSGPVWAQMPQFDSDFSSSTASGHFSGLKSRARVAIETRHCVRE